MKIKQKQSVAKYVKTKKEGGGQTAQTAGAAEDFR